MRVLALFLGCFITFPLVSQSVRGNVRGSLSLEGNRELVLFPEELAGLELGQKNLLLQGLQLTVKESQEMASLTNSFALYIYQNQDGPIKESQSTYRGSQKFMTLLRFTEDLNLLIPLNSDHLLASSRYAKLVSNKDWSDGFPYIIVILPVTKGIPDTLYNTGVELSLAPIYYNKARLDLKLFAKNGEVYKGEAWVNIGGETHSWPFEGSLVVSTDHKTMVVRSEEGVEETVSLSLRPGQEVQLSHTFLLAPPTLTISAVEGTKIYLDGKYLSPEELLSVITITPGAHELLLEIEGEQSTQNFTAFSGQNLHLNISPEFSLEYQ